MRARLDKFTRNGAPRHVQPAAWLQLKSVLEYDIQQLPVPPRHVLAKRRKRISVGGRLLTRAVLQEMEDTNGSMGLNKRGSKKQIQGSGIEGFDIKASAVL
jgi:hypothetical protein